MRSLIDVVQEGFSSEKERSEQQELDILQIMTETEYQTCLMELNSTM